jgi:regulator of sigma E protease
VLEFAIGMGPKIYSWTGKQGTKYALRAFPIGGFVQMEGEEGTSENPNAYNNLNPWKKIVVTAAGPLVNVIFAVILMFVLVISSPKLGSTTVSGFLDNSVTESQLMIGDEIIKVGDTRVHTGEELYYEIMMQGFETVDLTVKRDGKETVLHNVVFNTIEDSGAVFGDADFTVYPLSSLENVSFFDYLYQAFYRSVNTVRMVVDSIWGLISGRFGINAVSGPIGIVETVGEVASVSMSALVNLIVLLSMNLGIMNLLPIPALDGGRILFHLIDGIAGRKVIKKEIEDTITAVTLMLLLGFMLLISVKDVINLF